MKSKYKKPLMMGLLLLAVVVLSGCVRYDATGNPSGWVYEYIGIPTARLIDWIANTFNGSYGVAIIIITTVVRLLMLPSSINMTRDSIRSQAKMKLAQPEINEIQAEIEAASSDEEKMALNAELMSIYKKYDINTFAGLAGCLPLLIQMPIISAVYAAIRSSEAIRQSTFLGVPLGERSIVITIAVGVVYLIQSWMMKQSMPQAEGNEQVQATSNSMLWMNPIMLTWITYASEAGLGLYFLAGGIFAIIQQAITTYIIRPRTEAEVAKELEKYKDLPKRKKKTRQANRQKSDGSQRLVPTKQAVNPSTNNRNAGKQKRKK